MDMTTTVELWAVVADRTAVGPDGEPAPGLWLVSGNGPIVDNTPVQGDAGPWLTMENLCASVTPWDAQLGDHDPRVAWPIKHGTSWREIDEGLRITFIAVATIPANLVVRDVWPNALPITPKLLDRMRRPALHAADEPPETIAQASVLYHALRHLLLLDQEDDSAHEAMPGDVRTAISELSPALARMYRREPQDGSNVLLFPDRRAA